MAHRLWFLLIPLFLLTVAARSGGQTQPEVPPTVLPFPPLISAEKVPLLPVAKELTKKELDRLVEMAFGADCAELRQPIRVWIAELNMIVTAKEASVASDARTIRFVSVSIGLLRGETRIFRGDEAMFQLDNVVVGWKEIADRTVSKITLHDKASITTLTPFTPLPQANSPKFTPLPQANSPIQVGMSERARQIGFRFDLKIDPKTPLTELLPAMPKKTATLPLWTNEDLAKVPELMFSEPLSKNLTKHKAMETTAQAMAKRAYSRKGAIGNVRG